ncbi:MAG: indole-3-glycerol phosphate synthase TrpC [Bacillota bacterium]
MAGGGFLEVLVSAAREEVSRRRARLPLGVLRDQAGSAQPRRRFRESLRGGSRAWPAIVAEIKRASPSRGPLMNDCRADELASRYEAAGARAISVVTEPRYFRGRPEELAEVGRAVSLPVLRKDFVVDEYQVYETAALGADAVLLIARVLPDARLAEFCALARELGIEVLVEVHEEAELERVLAAGVDLVGINNRDLSTFRTDLGVTERLAPRCPPGVTVVSESGIRQRSDLERLAAIGVRAALVGEALLTSPDPAGTLRWLAAPPEAAGWGAAGGGVEA